MAYKPPQPKRKRGCSSLAGKGGSKSLLECLNALREAGCTGVVEEEGVVVGVGIKALKENGSFETGQEWRMHRHKQQQQQTSDQLSETSTKKLKLDTRPHHEGEVGVVNEEDKNLHLFPEEVVYLCHNGCLSVYKPSDPNHPLPFSELWYHFTSRDCKFLVRYISYWHFRAGGWVPKCGLKFGADLVLYKGSPSEYHSSYAVLVSQEGSVDDEKTWQDLAVSVRVNEAAKKDVLVCTVQLPEALTAPQSPTHTNPLPPEPDTIMSTSILYAVIKRWVPDRSREVQF